MKFLTLAVALCLATNMAFAAKPSKKVSHDKEHHHTGAPDHEHEETHHKPHDHKAHHPDHDPKKEVGEDEHSGPKK
jgi:hypothetical protein